MVQNKNFQELLSYPVDTYFDDLMIKKSGKYLLGVRITDFHEVEGKFIMASIHGTKKYLTSISIVDNQLSFKCSCARGLSCKHAAALYQYAQNKLNIKVYYEEDIKNITSEEIYDDIKYNLNGRTFLSVYNIDVFEKELNDYKGKIFKLYDKGEYDEAVKLFVKIVDAMSKFTQQNNEFSGFVSCFKAFLASTWKVVEEYFESFIKAYRNVAEHSKILVLDYLFNNCLELCSFENEDILLYFEKEIKNAPNALSYKAREEMLERIFFIKVSNQINNGDYNNLYEIKKRLQLIDYRYLYLSYLEKENNITEIKELYLKYNNYKLFPEKLFLLYIRVFEKAGMLDLLSDCIFNYVQFIDIKLEKLENLINNYLSVLTDELTMKIGLALYLSSKVSLINSLSKKYENIKIYGIALNTFNKFDEGFDDYIKEYSNILKIIYYKKAIELLKEDYLLGAVTKRKVMKCITRLQKLPNGEYYIFDIYEYFRKTRYRGAFPELDECFNKLDL